MKVLKFGGTSVGTTDSLRNVKRIVDGLTEPAVVVVSALGGLTDRLIATARKAEQNDSSFRDDIEGIRKRHLDIIADVIDPSRQADVLAAVEPLLDELAKLYEGVSLLGNLSERSLDLVVSFGERMSSVIVSRMVAEAEHIDSLRIVKTEKWFGKNIADTALTEKGLVEALSGIGTPGRARTAVMGGFISTDRDSGEITNLGRGGSDYTAALVAAALNAGVLEIWTDVDGFMTADPRIVKDAIVLERLSFIESMELCTFGAKVVYPPTIYPVFHKGIPIRVLNTFNPEAPGTWITDTGVRNEDALRVKGTSLLRDTALVAIEGPGIENICEINSRTFNSLAKQGISVRLVDQPDAGAQFSFAVEMRDIDSAMRVLEEEFAPELIDGSVSRLEAIKNLSTLAVVGENMRRHSGTATDILSLLRTKGIDVYASSVGVSETTAAYVVEGAQANDALQLAHSYCFPKN